MLPSILTQSHGYRSGHQLLQSNVALDRRDQDLVDRLSDIAGPLRPGEIFSPYLTAYPLPSHKYYVIALTEQDIGARRAGCVSTYTAFIEMNDWAFHTDPAMLVRSLSRHLMSTMVEPSFEESGSLAPVHSPVLFELVEALFLEKRASIVLFDPPCPNTIALRLLSAFWPGMRRNFSLCTFALSPRTLVSKNFDLVIAPKNARSRFSDWEGRRIEAGGKSGSPRHKWTSPIVERIFFAEQVALFDRATMESLAIDNEELESAFRITFLWEELLEKSKNSPTAVLGLIDIANSRNVIEETWSILEEKIFDALENIETKSEPSIAWEFVDSLLGKLSSSQTKIDLGHTLRSFVLVLSRRDWKAAITYLSTTSAGQRLELDLQRRIVISVIESAPADIAEVFCEIPAPRLLDIIALDKQILSMLRLLSSDGVEDRIDIRIIESFKELDPSRRKNYWVTFLPEVRGDQDLEILAALMEGAAPFDLEFALKVVWAKPRSRGRAVGQFFCEAAIRGNVREPMRSAFAKLSVDEITVECIEQLIEFDLQSMNWLLENEDIVPNRARLLTRIVDLGSLQQLNALLASDVVAERILQIFSDQLQEFAIPASKILLLPLVSSSCFFESSIKVLPLLDGKSRLALEYAIASRVFSRTVHVEPVLVSRALSMIHGKVDIRLLLTEVLSATNSAEQISSTIDTLEGAPVGWRTDFVFFIELITRQLMARREFDLTASASLSFSRLLDAHFVMYPYKSAALSSYALGWIMNARTRAASEILKIVFPIVYRNIHEEPFSMIKVFMFANFDRRKEARRDLVRAFLASSWPPLDLAVIAYQIHELGRVFMRLVKEPNGRSFLLNIAEEAGRLNEPMRSSILEAAGFALKTETYISESDT